VCKKHGRQSGSGRGASGCLTRGPRSGWAAGVPGGLQRSAGYVLPDNSSVLDGRSMTMPIDWMVMQEEARSRVGPQGLDRCRECHKVAGCWGARRPAEQRTCYRRRQPAALNMTTHDKNDHRLDGKWSLRSTDGRVGVVEAPAAV
jgi:hypothetical protein